MSSLRSPRPLTSLCPVSIGPFWSGRGVSWTIESMSLLSVDCPKEGISAINYRAVPFFWLFMLWFLIYSMCNVWLRGSVETECCNTSPSSPSCQPRALVLMSCFCSTLRSAKIRTWGISRGLRLLMAIKYGARWIYVFFLKTKCSLSLLRSYRFNEQRQYN